MRPFLRQFYSICRINKYIPLSVCTNNFFFGDELIKRRFWAQLSQALQLFFCMMFSYRAIWNGRLCVYETKHDQFRISWIVKWGDIKKKTPRPLKARLVLYRDSFIVIMKPPHTASVINGDGSEHFSCGLLWRTPPPKEIEGIRHGADVSISRAPG